MKKKMYWGIATLILIICVVGVYFMLQPEPEPEKKYIVPSEANLEPASETKQPPREAKDGFTWEWHGDHWHEVPIAQQEEQPKLIVSEPEPSRDFTPTQVQIPEGITDPDVLAAWERVEYIANNIWEWGGVPSPETEELIAQLMPPPDGFSGPTAHRDGEETGNLIFSLDPNDPRSAEVMATYLCEGIIGGLSLVDALVDVGVPAVPYLIPYMLDMEQKPFLRRYPIMVLGRIAERHREDLGGIVDHILIPRWEAILAEEKPDYDEGKGAHTALARLK